MPLHSFKCPSCGIEQEELFSSTESIELTCFASTCVKLESFGTGQGLQGGVMVGTKMDRQPGSISAAHFNGTDFHNGQGF